MSTMPGLYPAEVASYDPATRTCRVRIIGITDGSSALPVAEIMPPVGDRSYGGAAKDQTELRILPDDPVWVMFEAGDPRFPLIMGARLKREGNASGWRRWRHENIEMTADNEMVINAAKLTIKVAGAMTTTVGGAQSTTVSGAMTSKAATSAHEAGTHALTAQTTISGAIATKAGPGGASVSMAGTVAITGDTLTHNGKNVGAAHAHGQVQPGSGTSGTPV